VGSVRLVGVLVVNGVPTVIRASTGSFSGAFIDCPTPSCIQGGIAGGADFDTTVVPLTGTAEPTGSVSGSCQGGGIGFVADGEVLGTTCHASIGGRWSGSFQLIVDAPVRANNAGGIFCASKGSLVSSQCDIQDELSGLVSGLFP
jgi:hypothetical protein